MVFLFGVAEDMVEHGQAITILVGQSNNVYFVLNQANL
jgi:hypothetical protein